MEIKINVCDKCHRHTDNKDKVFTARLCFLCRQEAYEWFKKWMDGVDGDAERRKAEIQKLVNSWTKDKKEFMDHQTEEFDKGRMNYPNEGTDKSDET